MEVLLVMIVPSISHIAIFPAKSRKRLTVAVEIPEELLKCRHDTDIGKALDGKSIHQPEGDAARVISPDVCPGVAIKSYFWRGDPSHVSILILAPLGSGAMVVSVIF